MWMQIASDPVREQPFAEIWTGSGSDDAARQLVAEVSAEGPAVLLRLWEVTVDAQEFRDYLERAIARIT
jgi:hypothetical protein